MKQLLLVVLGFAVLAVIPAGAADPTVPGTRAASGKVSEWPLPTPKFANYVAVAPDGSIYITIMSGNRIARFDPAGQTFREWELPSETKPHAVMFDRQGQIWLTGNGNGTLNLLDPVSGKVTPFKTPSGAGGPHSVVTGDAGDIWFTGQRGNYLARFVRAPDGKTGSVTEYKMPGEPQGLVVDRQGIVWVCRYGADKLGKLNPKTGVVSELSLVPGSRPRQIAMAPDGTLWVSLYGRGTLAHVDPVSNKVLREYLLPAGPHAGPYSVAVDGGGKVWVNEIESDSVVRVDPEDGTMRVFTLPSKSAGIRSAAIDAQGRYWYAGSHNGRLGLIE